MIICSTVLNTQAKVIEIYGGTTWSQITDRFLLAASSTYAAKSTGGSSTHTHTTGNHTLTTNEIPAHTHGESGGDGGFKIRRMAGVSMIDGFWGICAQSGNWGGATLGGAAHSNSWTTQPIYINAKHTHSSVGGDGAHNHGNTGSTNTFPSYYAVYIWERTA